MRETTFRLSDIYKPTPKQAMFHASDADELLWGGAAGGGKSTGAIADAFINGCRFPGFKAYFFRREYPDLRDTVIPAALHLIPKEFGHYVENRHDFEFVNGSVIRFRHCFRERDMYSYQGAEMWGLYIDELTQWPEQVFDYLKTRVRCPKWAWDMGVRPFVKCMSNPGGIGHGWVKARFVTPHPKGGQHTETIEDPETGKKKKVVIQFIPATVRDNPHISQDYIFQLLQKPKALREALLDGSWDSFEGQVFVEWTNDPKHYGDGYNTHVITPFAIPNHWPHWMSYDHGYEKPFSIGWWAVDERDLSVYRYAEWYGSAGASNEGLRLDVGQIAEGIKRREEGMHCGMTFSRVADPEIFREDRGKSVAQLFREHGIYFRQGDNTREAGKMQVHYRLRMRPEMGDDGKPLMFGKEPMQRPRLQVFSTCRDFIRTIPALPYSTTQPEDVDTKAEDHCYDDMRYFLMEFPEVMTEEPPEPQVWTPPPLQPLTQNRRTVGGKYVPR